MTPEERGQSKNLVYQLLPSRYGMNPDDLRKADAIEVVIGQGAKPGGGGMLLGQKISDRVADMRTLPKGIDQRSACRHPDWTGPDDLEIKILELREKAKDALGDKFDIKKFHTIVLDQGIVPLFILEDIINEWIESF